MPREVGMTGFDLNLVAYNVRFTRELRGWTQAQLAQAADVNITTVYQVEHGLSVRRRSLDKICKALDVPVESTVSDGRLYNILHEDEKFVVHRKEKLKWWPVGDTRKRIPPDNEIRIQQPEERLRQGSLGFVLGFVSSSDFILPNGPGTAWIELYQEADISHVGPYRDAVLHCMKGAVSLRFDHSEEIQLQKGDAIGYKTKFACLASPLSAEDAGQQHSLLLWTGANRVGRVLSARAFKGVR